MRNLIKFMLFVMVFTMSLGVMTPVSAADLAINVGAGSTTDNFDNTYPVEDQSAAEVAGGGPTEVHIQYAATGEFGIGDTVTIVASAGVTIANTCATPTTDADADTTADGAGVIAAQVYTYTFTAATTAGTTSVAFCLNVTHGTAGNFSFLVGDANGDSGSGMLYVDNDNDVTVTATVEGEELEFIIRNNTDTADTNVCALGTLTTSAVSTCSYRLKVRTTATEGYTIHWTSDGGLDSSGTATIDAIAVSTAVAAGTEGYGVQFYPGAVTDGGACTAQGIWGAGFEDPVSTTPQTLNSCANANLVTSAADLTNTALVDHKAAIGAGTPQGTYDQVVTYYVTANF